MIAALGIEGLIVVATDDAVMIASKSRAQDIGQLSAKLEQAERSEYALHPKVHRPWGYYQCVDAGNRFQVKRISVNPGAGLSLQTHQHRAEHWVVVSGTARVVRGEETFDLQENQSTYIPPGMKHRLDNLGTEPLRLIEVQSGSYLGEDDIVRLEDRYGRAPANRRLGKEKK